MKSPPVVINGYDVVAYQLNVTGCDALKGKSEHAYNFSSKDQNGIERVYTFLFADENNKNILKYGEKYENLLTYA